MLSDARAETSYRHLLALSSWHRHGRATHWHNWHTRWTAAKSLLVLALYSEKEDIRSRPAVSNSSRTTDVAAVDKRNPILLERTYHILTDDGSRKASPEDDSRAQAPAGREENIKLHRWAALRLHTISGTRYPPEKWWQYVLLGAELCSKQSRALAQT